MMAQKWQLKTMQCYTVVTSTKTKKTQSLLNPCAVTTRVVEATNAITGTKACLPVLCESLRAWKHVSAKFKKKKNTAQPVLFIASTHLF